MYVPVVSKSGKPLMPCKPSKARKLLKRGLAAKKWNKLGIFYIQLTFDPTSQFNKKQYMCLGLDPGAKFDGISINTKEKVQITGMAELPKGISKKMSQRRILRRGRRYRKYRRRPKRFNNRKRAEGWLAPEQRAKVEFRLKVIEELRKLYPITDFAVEDVRFNHYKKRWGKYFSTVEIGKAKLYNQLLLWSGKPVHIYTGIETSELREELGLKKDGRKSQRTPNSHAVDAMVLATQIVNTKDLTTPSFFVWKRYQNRRRQLHKIQFKKGGERPREGGSNSLPPFKKNDVVLYNGRLARVGGYRNSRISLHAYNLDNKRFTQKAKPEECIRLFNQQIMYAAVPLTL